MRMYLNKSFKRILILLILVTGVLGSVTQGIVEGQVVSGTVNDSLKHAASKIDNGLSVTKYAGNIYSEDSFVLNSTNNVSIEVIPLHVRRNDKPIKILDDFILEKHGTAQITWQGMISNQVSRVYNLHSDHFEIFTNIKLDSKALVLHTIIDASSIEDLQVKKSYLNYQKIVADAPLFFNEKTIKYTKLNPQSVKTNIMELHKNINYEFINNI